MGPTSCWFTSLSFHVNWPSYSCLTAFSIWPWKSKVNVISPWYCTTTGLDNSTKLPTVQIHPPVSQICVPQYVWTPMVPDLWSSWPMGKPIWGIWANYYGVAQLQIWTIALNFEWSKSVQRFRRYAFCKVWTPLVPDLTRFWPMGTMMYNFRSRQFHRTLNKENLSSSFRYKRSAKSGSRLPSWTCMTIPLWRAEG